MFLTEGNCLDPQCTPCRENEYQAGYTVSTQCALQPYCDPSKSVSYTPPYVCTEVKPSGSFYASSVARLPSFRLADKNFVPDGPVSTEKQVVCVCKDGYHCSSQACITCVEHSHCAPGQRVQDQGTTNCKLPIETQRQNCFADSSRILNAVHRGTHSRTYFDFHRVLTPLQGTTLMTQCVKIVHQTPFLRRSLQTVIVRIGLCEYWYTKHNNVIMTAPLSVVYL